MHETVGDLAVLQALLDRSYDAAGEHYRRITTPDRRLDAAQVTERLAGMTLLVLATGPLSGWPSAVTVASTSNVMPAKRSVTCAASSRRSGVVIRR